MDASAFSGIKTKNLIINQNSYFILLIVERTMQYFVLFISLVAGYYVDCSILINRHGFNSISPLQAPPLAGSYRYHFRSVQHNSRGRFHDDDDNNGTWSGGKTLKEIITNLHKIEDMFFGNNSFFNNFNFKHKRNRTRLAFPKWFDSWPDFDEESSSPEDDDENSTDENTTDDPCDTGGGGFDHFDDIIMEIKTEIDDFFSDMKSIFPNFHRNRNSTDSSSEESDWIDEFLDDIKKSFDGKKHKDGDKPEQDKKDTDEKKERIEKIKEQPKPT